MLSPTDNSKNQPASRLATILMHRRVNNLKSGSGVHLMCLCACLIEAGYEIRIILAPRTSFGRIPFCKPDKVLAEHGISIEWPKTVRIGGIYVSSCSGVWAKAIRRLFTYMVSALRLWLGGTRRPYPSDLGKTLGSSEARKVQEAANKKPSDLVIAEYSSLAPLLGGCDAAKRATLIHDLLSSRAGSFRQAGRAPDHTPITVRQECERLMQADLCIHASQLEANLLQEKLPHIKHIWMRPLIADNRGALGGAPRVVFIGTSHDGNRAALDLIVNDIWPRVRAEVKCELWIVGEISSWVTGNPEGIRCFHPIEDLCELANGNSIGIAPMLAASGISIKIGTYLELGMRVLTFEDTLKAYGDTLDGLVTAVATPEEFSSALISMLKNQDQTAQDPLDVLSQLQATMKNDELLNYLKA
ncbi:glycosyltransferase family 4 protein [Leisingera sp. HS039]|uniref:glycosyltransferase n=1 Tax=Leisingera sp. HS039 TaxID=2818496 RepID=UPI001B3A63D0|nr:glycosyltransferase family 4 protein [Leisingera sp. HS039]MBQ4824477.1 glycosyltransferase family 4 protein [Leisingera sp. HS039]